MKNILAFLAYMLVTITNIFKVAFYIFNFPFRLLVSFLSVFCVACSFLCFCFSLTFFMLFVTCFVYFFSSGFILFCCLYGVCFRQLVTFLF